jgi:hypothetical protein
MFLNKSHDTEGPSYFECVKKLFTLFIITPLSLSTPFLSTNKSHNSP